jgi:hypothetical protein
MKMVIVSIRDRAADAYGRPAFMATEGVAIRSFSDEVNNKYESNQMYAHPDDFDLFLLGTYDDNSGSFDLLDSPKQLCLGKQVKIRDSE